MTIYQEEMQRKAQQYGCITDYDESDHGDFCRRSQSGTATDRLTVAHHHTLKQKAQDKMPF